MAMEVDVAIVGGGMAGLAVGIGLRLGGIQVHIFEKSPQKRKHFGTGMSIGENGFQALEGIKAGLGEKVGSVGQLINRFTQRIRIPGEEERVAVQLPQRAESNRLYAITWRAAYDVLLDEFQSLDGVVHYEHAFLDYKLFVEVFLKNSTKHHKIFEFSRKFVESREERGLDYIKVSPFELVRWMMMHKLSFQASEMDNDVLVENCGIYTKF